MNKLNKVFVELYELYLSTSHKGDRSGRVVSTGSLKIDDLIAIAVSRRSDINAATMKAVYEILKEVALEEVAKAKQVEFGLTYNGLGVHGPFIGDHPVWNHDKNRLHLHSAATAEVRQVLKEIQVEVLGMAQTGVFVNTLTDVVSGEVNARLTPGGGVNLTGSRIKVDGNDPTVGLYLIDVKTGVSKPIPLTSIPINEPSRMTFIVPANLPAGDYKLNIITQFSLGSTLLKTPLNYVFDYVLACS